MTAQSDLLRCDACLALELPEAIHADVHRKMMAAVGRIEELENALRDIRDTDSFTPEAGVNLSKRIARRALGDGA